MRRRQFIALASLGALAGCGGGGDGGGGTSPRTSSTATSTTTSTADDDPTTTRPTTARSTESSTTTATTRSGLDLGKSYESAAGRQLSVLAVRAQNEIKHTGEGTISAGEGEVLVLVKVRAENETGSTASLPNPTAISLVVDSRRRSPYQARFQVSPGKIREPIVGRLYDPSHDVEPGVDRTGWLVYRAPAAVDDVTVVWQPSGSYGQARWRGEVDPGRLPDVSLAGVSGPEAVELADAATFEVTAKNAGKSEGTFAGTYRITLPRGKSVQDEFSTAVPPRGQSSVSVDAVPRSLGTVTFELLGRDASVTSTVVAARQAMDSRLTIPGDVSIAVGGFTLTDSYAYRNNPTDTTVTADPGKQFALAEVVIENKTDGERRIPGLSEFVARGGGSTFEHAEIPPARRVTLTSPVQGQEYDKTLAPSLAAGETAGGWIVFAVDASLTASDLVVEASWPGAAGDVGVRFVPGGSE